MQNIENKRGNTFTGILGALIGGVIGLALWMIVARMGYVASLVGLVAAVLSGKLYDVFGGYPGVAKVIVVIICVLIAVLGGTIGNYYWYAWELYDEELEECVEIYRSYYDMTDAEARVEAEKAMDEGYGGRIGHFKFLMEYTENQKAFEQNILMGLFYALIGCLGLLFGSGKKRKGAVMLRGFKERSMMAEANIEAEQDTEE